MAKISGEVIFKVTFKDYDIPIDAFTPARIHQQCAKQVYLNGPLTKSRPEDMKGNFKVEIIKEK